MSELELREQLIIADQEVYEDWATAEAVAVALFNKHYCVVSDNGKVAYALWPEQPKHYPYRSPVRTELALSNKAGLTDYFAGLDLRYKKESKDGQIKIAKTSAFALWAKSTGRRTYSAIAFDADHTNKKALNLYFGLGHEALGEQEGDWSHLQRLIIDGICGNEPDPTQAASELFKLLAWKLRNPTRPAEKCVVIRGRKGSGKNTLLEWYADVLGASYTTITSKRDDVFGRFNSHLKNCALLVLNEAFWRGNPTEEADLKALITDPKINCEVKFGAKSQVPNSLLLFMLANAEWVAPASLDERRFVVYDIADHFRGDKGFFAALNKEMENGGVAAFGRHLMSVDIQGWHPRDMADTRGIKKQKEHSLTPGAQWVVALTQDIGEAYGKIKHEALNYRELTDWTPTTLNTPLAGGGEVSKVSDEKPLVLGTATIAYRVFKRWAELSGIGGRYTPLPAQQELRAQLTEALGGLFTHDDRARVLPGENPVRLWKLAPRAQVIAHLAGRGIEL